jgi:DNA-3-methyladenine glycosylase I
MLDAGIMRHGGKIAAAINNAKRVIELRHEFGSLASLVWRLEPDKFARPARVTPDALKAATTSPASIAPSKDLRKLGWTFVGPTTMYAFIQAMCLVNDHIDGCASRAAALAARAVFNKPSSLHL